MRAGRRRWAVMLFLTGLVLATRLAGGGTSFSPSTM